MPLNVGEQTFFAMLAKRNEQAPNKNFTELTLSEFRENEALFKEFTATPADVAYQDKWLRLTDNVNLQVRVYDPGTSANSPALIMFPGNGYFLDLFESNASACSRIAAISGVKVLIVNTPISPEVNLPSILNQAFGAVCLIARHADEFGIDPQSLTLGGMSSGAHCAATVAMLAVDEVDIQIQHLLLLNGIYDYSEPHRGYLDYERYDPIVQRDATPIVANFYGVSRERRGDPIYSPIHNPNMRALPPTTIIVAEYDGLRGDSEDYFLEMQRQGADVRRVFIPGQSHNTFLMRDVMTEGPDPAAIMAQNLPNNQLLKSARLLF